MDDGLPVSWAAGAPYSFLEISGMSGGGVVAAAAVAHGTGAESRWGWGVTGHVSLTGEVLAVGSVRSKVRRSGGEQGCSRCGRPTAGQEDVARLTGGCWLQAVAAFKGGLKGLILPTSSLADLSGDWPAGSMASAELRQQWEEARQQLDLKGVGSVEELLPSLADKLPQQEEARAARPRPPARSGKGKAAAQQGAAADVGEVVSMGVHMDGDDPEGLLAKVEACVVRGAGPPVRRCGRAGVGEFVMVAGQR